MCLGQLLRGVTPWANTTTGLCLPSRAVAEVAAHLGGFACRRLTTQAAGRCPGSQRGAGPAAGALISRKRICLHAREVSDEDGDSPRDLLTSLPGSIAIWLS